MEKMKKLNIGCGSDYKSSYVNLDNRNNIKADIRHDLDEFPYPFRENSFDFILASHILEHLKNPIKTLNELVRISKNKAKIIVNVPHATSYANLTDLQHKTNFTETSFSKKHLREYELVNLKLIKSEFYFVNKWKKYIPFKKYLKIFFMGIYDDIHFEFKVVK